MSQQSNVRTAGATYELTMSALTVALDTFAKATGHEADRQAQVVRALVNAFAAADVAFRHYLSLDQANNVYTNRSKPVIDRYQRLGFRQT